MSITAPSKGSWTGQLASSEFRPEAGRYHLYVGWFCPFAHRVLLMRELKGLQDFISISVVKPYPKDNGGWRFPQDDNEYPGSTIDHLYHSSFLHEIYFKSPPDYEKYGGKYSVPVLWDKKTQQIVNNESHEIMRQLNSAFNHLLQPKSPQQKLNVYPADLQEKINEYNSWLMPDFNSGVYKAGFAPDQESYEPACQTVFRNMERLDHELKLHGGPFLLGDRFTELDIKAYGTLIRFDPVYVQHFKLNIGTVRHNYLYVHRYLKNLYWNIKGFKETTNFKHVKENYTKSHGDINPKAITPLGPLPHIESWTEEDEKWKRSWISRVQMPDGSNIP